MNRIPSVTFPSQKMIAFIHIEKAAGQTFIRILENNYVYRHCRVAPLKTEHLGVFKCDDLRLLLKINPFLKAMAGHSIVPYSDLSEHMPDIRYITILRDPVKRYISHYQYWVQALNKQISFEEFLSLDELKDFQTKKIAGSPDLATAKKIVKEKIFLTGIVEEFDDFLVVLKGKLAPEPFDIAYQRKNVARANTIKSRIYERFDEYQDNILENNSLDLQLYDFVKNDVFKAEKALYFKGNDATPPLRQIAAVNIMRDTFGKLYRNLYIGPIINLIRKKNGLKVGGSY